MPANITECNREIVEDRECQESYTGIESSGKESFPFSSIKIWNPKIKDGVNGRISCCIFFITGVGI